MIGTVLQMVFALAVVLFMIYGMSYMMKKRQRHTGFMSMIEYMPFGPKKGVAALKVGPDVLILAVTPTDFRLLKTVSEKDLAPYRFDSMVKSDSQVRENEA